MQTDLDKESNVIPWSSVQSFGAGSFSDELKHRLVKIGNENTNIVWLSIEEETEFVVSKESFDEAAQSVYSRLLHAFQEEPVEDGISHAGEQVLERMCNMLDTKASGYIRSWVIHCENPTIGASILRLVGRLDIPFTETWRKEVIGVVLKHSDVEMRDAAVQAVELWDDQFAIDLLKRHKEKVGWLRDYIQRVIRDLTK